MKKIRVLHLITKLELGGAQRNTIYTCENLDREKFDVFLISGAEGILSPDLKKINKGRGDSEERFRLAEDLVREINPLRDLRAYMFLKREFKRLKPDIVHTHSSKAGIIGRIAAKRAGVPFVIHSVHGFSFSPFQSFLKRGIYKMIEKAVSRFTDHFIFVSEGDVASAEKLKLIKKGSFSLIRSGFDFGRFRKPGTPSVDVRGKYNIGKDDFVCGVIAPFKEQKGLFDLIKIASDVLEQDRSLLFFIAGDGDLRSRIELELEKAGIGDRFVMPGFVHDIENVISFFDIGISTSLWEGLPQSLVQMRLMKKAVVATDIPGNNEIIKDGINGYTIKVDSGGEFAEKILYLKKNDELRNAFSGHEEDLSDWDGNSMVRSQEDLYSSLMKRGEPG